MRSEIDVSSRRSAAFMGKSSERELVLVSLSRSIDNQLILKYPFSRPNASLAVFFYFFVRSGAAAVCSYASLVL